MIGSAEDDVVDGDEEQFDNVANTTHDGETNSTRCGYFLELCIGRLLPATSGFSQTSRKRRLAP